MPNPGHPVTRRRQLAQQFASQLPVRADDQHPILPGRLGERRHLGQPGMALVLRGQDGLPQLDRPVDRHGLVGQVQVRVGRLRAPVRIHQIAVSGARLQGLIRIADPARHEDRHTRVDLAAVNRSEAVTGPQIDPGPEDPTGRHRNELVPRLGVDTPSDTHLVVERDVVLHRPEIRQAEGHHLRALPVLLEPAPTVGMHRKINAQQPWNRRQGDLERLARLKPGHFASHWPCAAYLASTAAFCGRHQASLPRYQSIVAANPDSRSQ